MWEKEVNYKLSLKKNLIYDFCNEAYKESSSFDIELITKEKCQFKCHRVILALSSKLIKNLDIPAIDCVIELPDYSAAVVSSFIQFIYTGETIVDIELQNEFLSLCNEMMVNIPGLSNENFQIEEVENEGTEDATNETEEVHEYFMEIESESLEEPDEIIEELEEKSQGKSAGNNENEGENFEIFDEDTDQANQSVTSKMSSAHRRVLLKATTKEKEQISSRSSLDNYAIESSALVNASTQENNLQKAINAVESGLNTRRAALLYGIPKTTLYRKLSQAKINSKK